MLRDKNKLIQSVGIRVYNVRIRVVNTEIIRIGAAVEQAARLRMALGERISRTAMIHKLRTAALVLVGLVAVCVPVFAHHGGASYETDKSVNVKGTVTAYVWANPHVFVKVDVKDESGNVAHWIVEAQNPVSMTQIGWTKDTFKPGDEVEIDAMPARNGNPVAFLGSSSPTAPRRRIVINGKQFQP